MNHPDGTSFVSGDTHTLDPRIAACLSHATRPNQSTKRRALRDVVALIEGRASSRASSVTDVRESPTDEGFSSFSNFSSTNDDLNHLACSPETVAAALPQWHRAFARLADDDHAETRLLAARANAAFCAGAGRGLAAHLKRVAPAWFAAAHDEDAAVAAAASESFARVFPTDEKRRAVLTRYAGEVLRRVEEKLAGPGSDASPESGDDGSGSSEERRERSERTRAAALRALAGFARAADTRSDAVVDALTQTLEAIPGGLRACAASPSAKVRRAAYGAALAVATADGAYGEGATNATRNVRRSVLGTFETKRRAELAAVALLDATDERDGSSLGEARELTLGFLKRRGDDAWRDLSVLSTLSTLSATSNDAADSDSRYDASIDAFLGTLERHVSSGCHGAAEASAPSVLPLLAALPRGALFREEVRLRRLLASLWEGYALCNVPSRSADAAALLRAFREATLYGAIVVAEEGESEPTRESERDLAANAEAFRAELFRDAFLKRWIPEALRVTSLTDFTKKKTESDGSSSRALDAPLVAASLCECLVGVSRRPALAETCLRATMERTAADCERMVSGSSPGGRVDAPGARRVAAFHAALCDAAERRDAKDKKEKTTSSDRNVSAKRSADTAVRWVERAFARPIAVAAARAMASTGPTEAGAALLSSLVEKHGASCLVATDDERPVSDGERASATAVLASLLDACFENAHAPSVDEAKTSARARTLATVVRAAPGTWDDALRRASESARCGDASGLATVAAALLILHSENEDSDRESDRASASRSEGSWRRAALDAVVVDAATAKDARERLGPEAAALVAAAAATASVTPAAAAAIARSLASAVAGAAVASDAARDAAEAAEAWAWPPPAGDAGGDSADAWIALVAALFGARLDEETRPRGEGDDERGGDVPDDGSETSETSETSDGSAYSDGSVSSVGSEPDSPDKKEQSRAPASATWARVERAASRAPGPAVSARAEAEASARVAFVAETSRRLARLDAGLGCGGDERERVAAARRLAGAAASALAAFGADADDAAAAAASAALEHRESQSPYACYSVCRVAFLGALASLFGSWAPFLAAAAAADARGGEAPGTAAARLLAAHSVRDGTAYGFAVSRGVAEAFASALVAPLAETRSAGQKQKLGAEEEDPFASAAGALVREAVERGVEYGDVLSSNMEAALAALRANARVRPPSASSRARARAVFATAIRAAGASPCGGTESTANKSAYAEMTARAMRALALIVPLMRVDDDDDDDASGTGAYQADAAFDAFAAACAARAQALLSKEPRDENESLGPAVALAAACYSHDAVRSARFGSAASDGYDARRENARRASGTKITLRSPAESPSALLDLVRAVTRREAASAAAARFAKLQTPSTPSPSLREETRDGSSRDERRTNRLALVEEERLASFASLAVAAVERCGASLDARDWERVVTETRRLFAARVAGGEEDAEKKAAETLEEPSQEDALSDASSDSDRAVTKAGGGGEPAGWRAAAAGARLLLRLENLPVVVAPPDPANQSEGDVVPLGAQGAAARAVAEHLARAAWPSARAAAHASLARALMAAGAERHHAARAADPATGERVWRERRGAEGALWADAAALWSAAPGAAAVAAAAPWDAMDQWEEARCGAIAALYETLLCADEANVTEANVRATRFGKDSGNVWVFSLSALRRASYALLSSPALVKPAVVGFDCAVADVEDVQSAALEAEAEAEEEEDGSASEDARARGARLADRAALREPLAEKLLRVGDEGSRKEDFHTAHSRKTRRASFPNRDVSELDVSTLLCWALFLKHLERCETDTADATSSAARERLADFARGADAVSEIMRLALASLPTASGSSKASRPALKTNSVNGSVGSVSIDALPRVWRDAARAARDAGRNGAGGAGAAAAAATADALSPSFLFCERSGEEATTFVSSSRPFSNARLRRAERERLALGAYRACLSALPALTRTWFSDLKDASVARALASNTATAISPFLLEREFDAVERAATGAFSGFAFGEHRADSAGELTVRVSRGAREISATYSLDDAAVELRVRLPKAYPLVAAELETGARAGVSEARARKWRLAVGAILRHQNGAVASGLATWRRNVDREFAGVEPCPICYLVIHGSNHQLPRLRCGQCRNKFHNACLYKWFTSSSKSTCPLCQTPWGASYRG